jgi:hypothetical protein
VLAGVVRAFEGRVVAVVGGERSAEIAGVAGAAASSGELRVEVFQAQAA